MSVVRPTTVLSISAMGMMTTALVSAIIPDILSHFHEPDHRAGAIVAAATFPAIISSPVFGVLADRKGRIRVLRPCLFFFGLFGLLSALAPTFSTLLVIRFLQGIPAGGLIVLAVILISDQWSGVERGRMLGRNAAMLSASLAVFPIVSGVLAAFTGWRVVCLLYGASIVVLATVPRADDRTETSPATTFSAEVRGAASVAVKGQIPWALLAGIAAFALMFGWNVTLLPIHAEQILGMASGPRGFLVGSSAVAATAAALLLGGRATRARTGTIVLITALCFASGFGLVAVAGSAVVVVVLGTSITGASQGLLMPVLQNAIARDAPDAQRGSALSLWGAAVRVGQTIGPAAMALLLAHFTTTTSFALGAAITGAAAAAMAVGLLITRAAVPATSSTAP